MVESSNEWAKCARENGFPSVIDASMPPVGDAFKDPAALLPASITEDQLRQLLEKCPNFDPSREEKNEELAADPDAYIPGQTLPDGFEHQPNVGFDYPDFDCETSRSPSAGSEISETVNRLLHLCDILDEAEISYFLGEG
jgi:hypothetical protein